MTGQLSSGDSCNYIPAVVASLHCIQDSCVTGSKTDSCIYMMAVSTRQLYLGGGGKSNSCISMTEVQCIYNTAVTGKAGSRTDSCISRYTSIYKRDATVKAGSRTDSCISRYTSIYKTAVTGKAGSKTDSCINRYTSIRQL